MSRVFHVPDGLRSSCQESADRIAWLTRLPRAIAELEGRWRLSIEAPLDGNASWVAPVVRFDGSRAVLKLGMPHLEAESEADGLRFWDGDPTVRLIDSDDALGAMLIEWCEPGTPLRQLPEHEQDVVLAEMLRRLWRVPGPGHPFPPLAVMIEHWIAETWTHHDEWVDEAMVRTGIDAFRELASHPPAETLLATDLHAGNVLRAQREPWLVIDPKPFLGDPAYDATQHLLNCLGRMQADPLGTIRRYAGLLGVDADRVKQWLLARLTAEPRGDWGGAGWGDVTRVLARAT